MRTPTGLSQSRYTITKTDDGSYAVVKDLVLAITVATREEAKAWIDQERMLELSEVLK